VFERQDDIWGCVLEIIKKVISDCMNQYPLKIEMKQNMI